MACTIRDGLWRIPRWQLDVCVPSGVRPRRQFAMWSVVSPSATEVSQLGRAQDRGFQFPDIHVVVAVAIIPAAQGHMLSVRALNRGYNPAQDGAGADRPQRWPLATVYSPDMTEKGREPSRPNRCAHQRIL